MLRLGRVWERANVVFADEAAARGWLARGEAAALAVPSAVLPQEENFLLNPRHAGFRRIRIGKVEELALHSRLLRYV